MTRVRTFEIVNSMNNKSKHSTEQVLSQQALRLRGLVGEIQKCCQQRQLMETSRFDLPQAELAVLQQFGSERYLTPKGLAASLEVSKSRISKLLEQLIEKKMIQQVPDPSDKRVKLLCLSDAGRLKAGQVESFINGMHMKVLEILDSNQRSTVLSTLELLWSAMESAKADYGLNK